MHSKIYNIYKPIGQTPLEALENFRVKKKLPKELKITYAGRLDPMAEGILLLLTGNKVHEKEKFLKLDKTYKAQILFGVSTDTFDVLGKISKLEIKKLEINEIKSTLKKFIGKVVLPIPAFSSVPISGKPSFMHARAGKLSTKNSQSREMEIYSIKFNSFKKITKERVLKTVQNKIAKVNGDFRQEEILELWAQRLGCHCEECIRRGNPLNCKDCFGCTRNDRKKHRSRVPPKAGKQVMNHTLTVLDITIYCASGTYIRSIAHTLGEKLNAPALLYSLKREKVGKYTVKKSLKI